MTAAQPQTAIKIYNRVFRQKTYAMIYERKNDIEYYHEHFERAADGNGLTDQDLMIDIRIGGSKEIFNLYQANTENNVKVAAEDLKSSKQKAEAEFHRKKSVVESRNQRRNLVTDNYMKKGGGEIQLGRVADAAPNSKFDSLNRTMGGKPKAAHSRAMTGQDGLGQDESGDDMPDTSKMNKGQLLASIPLFLSAEYLDMYTKSKRRSETTYIQPADAEAKDKKRASSKTSKKSADPP